MFSLYILFETHIDAFHTGAKLFLMFGECLENSGCGLMTSNVTLVTYICRAVIEYLSSELWTISSFYFIYFILTNTTWDLKSSLKPTVSLSFSSKWLTVSFMLRYTRINFLSDLKCNVLSIWRLYSHLNYLFCRLNTCLTLL